MGIFYSTYMYHKKSPQNSFYSEEFYITHFPQWAQLGTQGDTHLRQDQRVNISECQHNPLHKPTLQNNELEHSIIWGFIKVSFDL